MKLIENSVWLVQNITEQNSTCVNMCFEYGRKKFIEKSIVQKIQLLPTSIFGEYTSEEKKCILRIVVNMITYNNIFTFRPFS